MTLPPTILTFLKNNYKWVLIVVLPILGFLGGRFLAPIPERVITQDKIVYVEKKTVDTKVVETDKTKTDEKVNKHVEKTVVKAKDGTITVKTVTDSQAVKTVYVDKLVDRIVKEQVFVDKVVEHTQIVDNQKRFRASLLVGVHPNILPVPQVESWAVGGEFEVRVIGPLWAGAWGMGTTGGQALLGLKASIEF